MTEGIKDLFLNLAKGPPDQLLFPDKNGNVMARLSNVFIP